MRNTLRLFSVISVLIPLVQLTACGSGGGGGGDQQVLSWPIASQVFTTADQQVFPIAVSAGTPQINQGEVSLYAQYGYSAWQAGSPAWKSRGYAIGAARIFSKIPLSDTTSHAYNAELVKQLTPAMQAIIANYGTPLQ